MKERLDGLTGLRGAAAMLVVLFHFNIMPLTYFQMAAWIAPVRFGYTGVDLFFVLSGFVISYAHFRDFSLLTRAGTARFLALRLARIYPLYFLSLTVLVAVACAALLAHVPINAEIADFGRLPEYLLLLQAWHSDGMVWNYPVWSLSAEWFAYLLFPFIAFGIHTIGSRRSIFILAAASLFLMTAAGGDYFHSAPLLRGTTGFLLGACCYVAASTIQIPNWVLTSAIILGLILIVTISGTSAYGLLPLFGLLVLACAQRGNAVERVFACKPVEYMGQISYSLYLVHAPVQMIFGRLLLRDWAPGRSEFTDIAVGGIFIAATIILSHCVYRSFELPTRRWLRSLIDRRSVAVA